MELTLKLIANHCSGCQHQTGIPLASLAASDHELERSRSLEPGIGRRGTRYSRLESPSGDARVENDI